MKGPVAQGDNSTKMAANAGDAAELRWDFELGTGGFMIVIQLLSYEF